MMHNPAHPGEVLRDGVFDGTSITVTDFANRIGVTRLTLSNLLNKRSGVSAMMALRLQAALGGTAESWLHMQANYDLWQAQQKMLPRIERLVRAA
jgi:addiction module HigA family antidote